MASLNQTQQTVALVTGGNQGIGLATATALARDHSYHVIIGSRNIENGQKVARSLTNQGFSASSVQLDLESEPSIASAVEQIEKDFGRLDVLVNNAAILIDSSPYSGTTSNLFKRTFNTNVIGTALLTQALLPLLRKAPLPRLVFVSSRMGSLTKSLDKNIPWYNLECTAYDSSKAALNMLAINYNRILSDVGAKVNIACPGLVATNLHDGVKTGAPPEVGAERIVELATLGKDGPSGTWSASDEMEIPW